MFYRERGLIAYEQTAWNVNVCYFYGICRLWSDHPHRT
jgi:hypothetical protein